ncbi:alpha-galactosidase [Deinococcus sp. MIMF12]|uniref:Alpha-galactosidase n=1 Tax=Deinococcus rhizophilus TaxID=3049544 RepID=A0ABT7JGC5_9DEIO|nr:glycoside hydrolase family 36 protein [Deinococcus rhizophilus]MDL2344006.1 alpha-galactosidase [Deinococcus rhizophilus]
MDPPALRSWTLPAPPEEVRVLVSGYQSWSEAELRPLTDLQSVPLMRWRQEQGHDPAFLPSGEAGVWRSHTLIALVRPDGGGWVGCAGNAAATFTHWEARAGNGNVEVTCTQEGPPTGVAWEETGDVIGTLEALAARLGQAMNARTPPPLRVWCSWYSYYRDVTLEAVLQNARLARDLRLPFDVFQLDDGFQAGIGDWLDASPGFGGHARDLPGPLRELGFTPGLWLAPFLAAPTSRLAAEHPEWLLRGEDGQPLLAGHNWGGPNHALDTTHPEVLTWLRDLAATVRGWGYPYLKLDFLFGGALPGVRHDPAVSRAGAYRMGLQALRDGAGEDAFLLGCGAPLAASVGLLDAMRTGPDVAPLWEEESRRLWLGDATGPSARNALHTALSRWYAHAWYQPDPDVAIVRRERSLLTEEERGAVAGMLDVIGGLRASSDPLGGLDGRELALLRRCLELSPPDRPRTLTHSLGGAVTHFGRGTFNLTQTAAGGIPAHGYRSREVSHDRD